MARYEHLPIYKEAFDLALYFEKTVSSMGRCDKHTLGTDLRSRGLLNWNDDQEIDLSDAVTRLSWLFQGGEAHILGSTCTPIAGCPLACR